MRTQRVRHAFTLIELLVVIAIIAILVGLISAAVIKALEVGTRTRVSAELRQLDAACVAFKVRFGDYPPSRVRLRRDGNYDLRLDAAGRPVDRLDFLTYRALIQFWPRLKHPINWNGDVQAAPGSVWDLEGDQCLVFFLGGIPYRSTQTLGCLGFSTDPSNPARPGGDRIQAFYDFTGGRLRDLASNGFWSYLDPHGEQPYAYFSSWNKFPGYADATGWGTDCPRLGIWPYAESPPTTDRVRMWHRSISFQILSAGRDGRFGPGTNLGIPSPGYWTFNQASAYAGRFPDAADDLSNFHDLLIGVPSN